MTIEYYGNTKTQRKRLMRRRIVGIVSIVVIILLGVWIIGVLTDSGAGYEKRLTAIEENHSLRAENEELKAEVERLTAQLNERDDYINELTGGEVETSQE